MVVDKFNDPKKEFDIPNNATNVPSKTLVNSPPTESNLLPNLESDTQPNTIENGALTLLSELIKSSRESWEYLDPTTQQTLLNFYTSLSVDLSVVVLILGSCLQHLRPLYNPNQATPLSEDPNLNSALLQSDFAKNICQEISQLST